MPQPLIAQVVLALLRHLLTLGGASLTTSGLLDGSQVDAGIGAVLVLAALGFSAFDKWKQERKTNGR